VVNGGKAQTLSLMGEELDRVRAGVWFRFAGVKSAALSKRQIRDLLMSEGAPAEFNVPQRLWRATVEDTVDKIRAWQQSVIATEVRPRIHSHINDDAARKRLLGWREPVAGAWIRGCLGNAGTHSPKSDPDRGAAVGLWPTTAPTTRSVTIRASCGSQ
jgi:hypothetical protein